MKKSEMFGFTLETDDRENDKRHAKATRGTMGKEAPTAPMDTDYQDDIEELKPQIRVNIHFDRYDFLRAAKC